MLRLRIDERQVQQTYLFSLQTERGTKVDFERLSHKTVGGALKAVGKLFSHSLSRLSLLDAISSGAKDAVLEDSMNGDRVVYKEPIRDFLEKYSSPETLDYLDSAYD